MTWQPIETAPKDATEILLFEMLRVGLSGGEHMMRVGYWEERGSPIDGPDVDTAGWSLADSGYVGEIEPTHWMPLPNPPEASNAPE